MHVHFIGIGGSGMSGLALMSLKMGYSVTGCDKSESPYLKMVIDRGIKCYKDHSAEHLEGVDIIVKSSAISDDIDEIVNARKKGIPIFLRGKFLSNLVSGKEIIGVAGSHGKTTTTWMIYHILKNAGLNPSVYAGGKSEGLSSILEDYPFIIELDESDGSIFETNPETLLINNLEYEHADYYLNPECMLNDFERYLLAWKPENLIIGRGYDLSDSLFSMFSALSFPTIDEIKKESSFQNTSDFDFYWKDFKLYLLYNNSDIFIGEATDPVHILQNRSSAMITSLAFLKKAGIKIPEINYLEMWKKFPGIDRRFQNIGKFKGVDLIDDYAHHPSEIKALAEQAERKYKSFCLIFQPHRISRFTTFYDKFYEVLKYVEPLIILPVYNAGEKQKGADSLNLYRELKKDGNEVYYCKSLKEAAGFVNENIGRMHVFAIVAAGAGDLNKIFQYLGDR